MAAWKKTPPAPQPVPAKQDNSTAISRINRLIAEENGKMEKYYQEVGKKYVQLHAADYEEGFSELIQALDASQRKLADYSMQMQFVTGVIICTSCGHKAPKGSVYCNMCGTKLPEFNFDNYEMCEACGSLVEKGTNICPTCNRPTKRQNENLVQCPNPQCGEFVGKDNRFCPVCGEPLFQSGSNGGAENNPTEKKCPKCGSMMSSDKLFCTECGTKLN